MDKEEILNLIPHRPPFLFVDRILEVDSNRIHTQKKISADEPFFKGHYPHYPIMPGVLILECVFQAGACLMAQKTKSIDGGTPVLTRIQNVKFRNSVYPDDLLDINVTYKENVGPAHFMQGKVSVDEKKILTVEFSALLKEEVA